MRDGVCWVWVWVYPCQKGTETEAEGESELQSSAATTSDHEFARCAFAGNGASSSPTFQG
eukprot:m.228284 g.228284  ORF g.228284 m.228284 type:complete len:60 (+) comp25972_c0_seq1:2140-2319(+)